MLCTSTMLAAHLTPLVTSQPWWKVVWSGITVFSPACTTMRARSDKS